MSKERIVLARTHLMFKHPFFGAIATRMQLKESIEIPTMAVDGRFMYFNTEFVAGKTDKEILFIVAHEVMHLVLNHLDRLDDRNFRRWNIATDYAVNLIVKQQNIGEMPKIALYDEKYNDMSADEIYSQLTEKSEEELEKLAKMLLDEHLGEDSDKNTMSAEDRRRIKDEIREAVLSAAAMSPESTPDCIKKMIADLDEPQVDWKGQIQTTLEGLFKNDYSYYRPHKKFMSMGLIMPGQVKQPAVSLDIAIDTSGSVYDDAKIFLSEVKGIMQSFTDYKIRSFCWDTKVHSEQYYDTYTISGLDEFAVEGGGGTNVECVFQYIEDHDNASADTIIILTDGEVGSFREHCNKKVIWVVVNNESFKPSFGNIINITSKKK